MEGGSADWRFKQYRNGREEAGCSDQYSRRDGDSCIISYSQHYHSGVYWCESASGQEHSNAVTLTVSNGRMILQTPPQPVFEGDSLTLRCHVRYGYKATMVIFYKDNRQLQSRADTELSVDRVSKSDEGSYKCKAWWWWNSSPYSGDSAEVRVTVREGRPKPALTREPAGEIFEGDTVTLSCVVEGGSGGWRYLWYKDRQGAPVYQTDSSSGTGAGYTISAAALSHSGEYWCGAGRGRNTSYSQYSDPNWVNVTALFSRVTLTASPGASVKEGEALNLTCEAAVNKTPRPELHYTIVRDGEPVTNSTDSALYSIASTEKSHTGSYTCAVESQGVKKSSQELHIELQTSWHSAVAIGYRVSFTLIHFIVFNLMLLQYCRIQGSSCLAGGKSRKTSDQDQEQSAEGIELSSRVQHTGVELE
ncbi:Fc receptor-like protein 6 [Acipenser ruthenus]|uniref:Fc receptor-like protein 6 n=1 Tax=Acipenser ruthenus TaxID=7906 RepID=UPI0027424D2B|nr:Fc receptor-like protein 6 [Acipenser ruthenus]